METLAIRDAGAFTRYLHNALGSIDATNVDVRTHAGLALALLAAGRFERVRAIVQTAADTDAAVDAAGESWTALPLIAARYVAWTGDLRTAAAAWQRIRSATDALFASEWGDESADTAADRWLRAATARELQRLATDLGDVMFAASLHRLASTGVSDDVGYVRTGDGDAHTTDSALTIIEFVHGLLGIAPDATRHRIRIRPRLNELMSFDIRQLRFGDSDLRIRADVAPEQDGRRYTLDVAQESGAIPVTVVLEPMVAGPVVRTLVDGRPADLAPRIVGEDTVIVPVQLVLDEERRLQIDVAARNEGGHPPK